MACISYTNVAVREIVDRLGDTASLLDVSTIHSLLYRNVVRPHLHYLRDAAGDPIVRHDLVDGHDEHRPTYPCIRAWCEANGIRMNFDVDQAAQYLVDELIRAVRGGVYGQDRQ